LLKAASFTRSPDTIIHGNVRLPKEKQNPPSATFIFSDGSPANFSQGQSCPQLRDNFAVFDSSCIRVYTDDENKFNVSPYGFDIFSGLTKVIADIQQKFQDEIIARTPDIERFQIPDGQTQIASLLQNITAFTDIRELETLQEFGNKEESKIIQLTSDITDLASKDTTEIIKSKRIIGKDINVLIQAIRHVNEVLGTTQIKTIEHQINHVKTLREISSAASAAQFSKELVQPIGTEIWVKLIEVAIAYNSEVFPGKPFPIEAEDARCVLCHQPLDRTARERLQRFFSFVRSDAEKNLRDALSILHSSLENIKNLNLDFFNAGAAIYRSLASCDKNLVSDIENWVSQAKKLGDSIVENIEQEKRDTLKEIESDVITDCRNLRVNLARDIKSLKKHRITDEKISKENELQFLREKRHLNKIFPDVKKAIENLEWIQKANTIDRPPHPRHVTEKQKDLTKKLLGQGFIEQFREECHEIGLELPETAEVTVKAALGTTSWKHSIGIPTRQMPDPSQVFSEGEQTAIALADFLAEIVLNKQPIGIIFDDPVNSMDHIFKENIAKRLVKEAIERQVIIFTHDILFVNALANEAEKIGSEKVEFKGCTVSVGPNDKTPGYIGRTVFPYEHYEKKSKEAARQYLEEAKSLTGKEQNDKLVLGCGALRAAYENFIQRHIFHDVVARWRENIMATALSQIYYDQSVNDAVVEHYKTLSRYEQGHSHSPEYHEVPLNCSVLESEIGEFEKITGGYKKTAEEFRKQKSEKKKNVFS
jgi:ABC-type dipeptide/oligopeptide/nickel transport system ATPase subunit